MKQNLKEIIKTAMWVGGLTCAMVGHINTCYYSSKMGPFNQEPTIESRTNAIKGLEYGIIPFYIGTLMAVGSIGIKVD